MINLPAAPAVPASHHVASGADAGLPPAPAANPGAADSALPGTGLASALLEGAAGVAPAPFAALLDAMAGAIAPGEDDSGASQPGAEAAATSAAAAQAVATMLPAIDHQALAALLPGAAGTPGATPNSVAAVAAALTAPAAASAPDQAALLRQQLQATALATPAASTVAAQALAAESARAVTAQAEALAAHEAALLDPRAALLAAAARPAAAPAMPAPAPATNPAPRQAGAMDALSAALGALQAQAADGSAAPITAKDGASLLADSQRPHSEAGTLPGFRSVLANGAGQAANADVLRLSGSPEQWQQPLRAALGDRLQLQLARNDQQAVIRLEPPNMGSVEISVRHSGGALHVNIAASHSEVLRQLNTIGDAVRQDLSQRQFSDVAVTVSSSGARNLAEGGGQQRQQQSEQQRQPGRALDEAEAGTTTFAMLSERE